MIFSKMISNDIDGITGYGIGLHQAGDIDYLVVVDIPNQMVSEYDGNSNKVLRELNFEDL
jgi:hypothetical protein